jgi:hypothetical protein
MYPPSYVGEGDLQQVNGSFEAETIPPPRGRNFACKCICAIFASLIIKPGIGGGTEAPPSEEAHSSFLDRHIGPEQGSVNPQHNQDLQRQIAEQLGVTVAQLSDPVLMPNAVDNRNHLFPAAETALSRECLSLIEAFTRITDPNERLRCLQIVREVAGLS